jgi:hypothetical protein
MSSQLEAADQQVARAPAIFIFAAAMLNPVVHRRLHAVDEPRVASAGDRDASRTDHDYRSRT